MTRLLFDVETDGLLDTVSVVHCLVIKNIDNGTVWSCHDHGARYSIRDGLHILMGASHLEGHNVITFDLPCLKKVYHDFNPQAKVQDTLVKSRLIWTNLADEDFRRVRRDVKFPQRLVGSHSLEAWGFRLGERKDDFGKTTDWKQWSPEMQAYCEQDVEVNDKLRLHIERQNYSEEAFTLEHEFQQVIFLQEEFGFPFDKQAAAALYETLVKRRLDLTTQLQSVFPPRVETMKTPAYYVGIVFDEERQFPTKSAATKAKARDIRPGLMKTKSIPFNPGSRDQIAARLKEKGWVPTKFTDTEKVMVDESVLEALDFPEAKLLSEYLLIGKRIGQLAEGNHAWLKLEKKGRIHGRVITNGAVTGRCTHMNPNVAQVPAVKKGKDKKVLLGNDGGYGFECRSLFTADPGFVLVGCDASGLELRCLAHYMAKYDGGEYGRLVTDGDVHTANQIAAGIDTRDIAKTFIYAYLYGAGDEKIGMTVGVKPEEVVSLKARFPVQWKRAAELLIRMAQKKGEKPKNDPKQIAAVVKGGYLRAQFEKKTPALAQLKADIAAVVKARGYLKGLDGRLLHVRSQHAALNTLLQCAGALLVKKATTILYFKLIARGYAFGRDFANLAHIHDELQIQARKDIAQEVGELAKQSIREAGEYFKFRVRLDGEFKIGRNWAETH